MDENDNIHPADMFADAAIDAVFSSETATDAVNTLGNLAGSVEKAFTNLVYNMPEEAIRLSLLKLLMDAHEDGDDDFVMSLMEFTAKATIVIDPGVIERRREEDRAQFDKDFGLS